MTPNPLYTSLPAPMYIYAHRLFRLLFLTITSFAIRLSGRKVAIKLIDWLNGLQFEWIAKKKNENICRSIKKSPFSLRRCCFSSLRRKSVRGNASCMAGSLGWWRIIVCSMSDSINSVLDYNRLHPTTLPPRDISPHLDFILTSRDLRVSLSAHYLCTHARILLSG